MLHFVKLNYDETCGMNEVVEHITHIQKTEKSDIALLQSDNRLLTHH